MQVGTSLIHCTKSMNLSSLDCLRLQAKNFIALFILFILYPFIHSLETVHGVWQYNALHVMFEAGNMQLILLVNTRELLDPTHIVPVQAQ